MSQSLLIINVKKTLTVCYVFTSRAKPILINFNIKVFETLEKGICYFYPDLVKFLCSLHIFLQIIVYKNVFVLRTYIFHVRNKMVKYVRYICDSDSKMYE